MKLAAARSGTALKIRARELDFSFYPMTRTNRLWGIHSVLYSADPWVIVTGSVVESV